ncbi:diguanylate cyclase [bacterium]|nr:MAG: diguanylate cyclase [bacterium]
MQCSDKENLLIWKEFQDGLASLLDVPIGLYDAKGDAIVAPTAVSVVCGAVGLNSNGKRQCDEQCKQTIANAVESKKAYIGKCSMNMHIFALPVFPGGKTELVIAGGHVYLQDGAESDFHDGVTSLGLNEIEINSLRAGIKVMAQKDIHDLPEKIGRLAAPLLKSLCSKTSQKRSAEPMRRLKYIIRSIERAFATIAATFNIDELCDILTEKAAELTKADRSSLMLSNVKDNVLVVKSSFGVDKGSLTGVIVKPDAGIAGEVLQSGKPLFVLDIEKKLTRAEKKHPYRTKSFISVPVRAGERILGVLNVADKWSGNEFTNEDFVALQALANYAAIACERAEYFFMNEKLTTLSTTDHLTGLYNRRYFNDRLIEEAERVRRHGENFSVFMIDLDNFKAYNDKHGHMAGDDMLKKAAHVIKNAVRSMDVVARYGGEEFTVILPYTDKSDAAVIADRIRIGMTAVDASRPDAILPTFSIGVAEFPADAETVHDIVENADKALYRAKATGKNKVVLHGE